MNRVFVKNLGDFKGEAWVEFWDSSQNEWEIGCRAKLLFAGKKCLIDTIDTPLRFRRRGFASEIIAKLKDTFSEVEPIGVIPSAKGFWEKHGMSDALGEERDE